MRRLNSKSEIRRSKAERNPKAEIRGISLPTEGRNLETVQSRIRISEFGLLSALGFRPSDFPLSLRRNSPGRKTQIVKSAGSSLRIIAAHSQEHLDAIRELFTEYSHSLDIDLCFQGFTQELAELPGRYAAPEGRLLLMIEGSTIAGCVALRKIGYGICEMKRLYLRPGFRRRGAGRVLARAIIDAAREIGYHRIRLDTLPSMEAAIALYRSLDFQPIAPYYENPSTGTIFMELDLDVGC